MSKITFELLRRDIPEDIVTTLSDGTTSTIKAGFMYTLKLLDDGEFRCKTTWAQSFLEFSKPNAHLDQEELIAEFKPFLAGYYKNQYAISQVFFSKPS